MEGMERTNKGLFPVLDGTPAHALIILGLTLILFAPLIPSFKLAKAASARLESEQADALIELDLADLKRDQEKERAEEARLEQESITRAPAPGTPEEFAKRQEELQKRQAERQKHEDARKDALDRKQEELKKKYDPVTLRRAVLTTQASVAGMRWHLVLAWLGRVALIVGLLVLTIQSEDLRQKILLVVLLVVLISALSGVNLDFQAHGSLGDSPAPPVRVR
jgi:hypothetical protein